MTELSIITGLSASKSNVQQLAAQAKELILSGEINPLDIAVKLKAMEDLVASLRKDEDINRYIISEAEKYEKSFEYAGANIQLRQSTKYDYSGDENWNELKDIENNAANARKAREALLKGVNPVSGGIDPSTGEVLNPPVKISSTSVAITLGK